VPRDAFVTALRERLGNELAPPATTPRGATRRRFVQAASLAATAAALGAGVDHLVDDGGSSRGSDQTLTPAAGRWRTVAAGADLPEGAVQSYDFGAVSGFVTRAGGEVRAVSGICTHQSCRLALDVASRQLNCPCHNAAFALTGEVLRHELKAPLRPLPHLLAREVDGDVQVYAP
jgi:nitrite reductase/ring-hydroxylating ferredoxin subunit